MTRIHRMAQLALLALLLIGASAQAATLRYTIAGTADLKLADTNFDDTDFTIVMIGDPATLDGNILPLSSASFVIAGIAETVSSIPPVWACFPMDSSTSSSSRVTNLPTSLTCSISRSARPST